MTGRVTKRMSMMPGSGSSQKKSRILENILPTQAAFRQHIKRASYQANCWNKALIPNPDQENGDGARIPQDGNHCGLPCPKHQNPVGN